MAERSIGMTTGSGDGDVGGYSSSRMTTFFNNAIGDGILNYGDTLLISGTGTAAVVISTGAAMVKGFFYENTTSTSLVTTGVADGLYYLAIATNNTGSPRTVARSQGTGATTTTLAAYTVRLAILTIAQYDSNSDVRLAQINISSGLFNSIPSYFDDAFSESRTLGSETSYVYNLSAASVASSTTAFTTLTTGATYSNSGGQNVLRAFTSSGVPIVAINTAGTYHVQCYVKWDTNTTGARILTPLSFGAGSEQLTHAVTAISIVNPMDANNCVQHASFIYQASNIGAPNSTYLQLRVAQNSGTARVVAQGAMRVTRI